MSKRTEEYFRAIPTKPYDLLREGLIVFVLAVVVIVVLVLLVGVHLFFIRREGPVKPI